MFDGSRLGLERRFGFDVGAEHGLRGGSGTGDQFNHFGSDIVESESGDLVVEELGAARIERAPSGFVGAVRNEGARCGFAVSGDHRSEFEVVSAPPFDVGIVTEGAEHEDAGALLRVGLFAREYGDFGKETGGDGMFAEKGLESLVVGVCGDGDTGGDHLGARSGNDEGLGYALLAVDEGLVDAEFDVVVGAGGWSVFDFGLGDRSLEIDVPHGWKFGGVDVAALVEVEEGTLSDGATAVVDGGVLLVPVDGETESVKEFLVGLFVFGGDFVAELDEIAAGDDELIVFVEAEFFAAAADVEVGDVGDVWFSADAEVVLDAALGRESVVVPAHGVDDVPTGHAAVSCDDVLVGVGEDVTGMEGTAGGRRRRVDDEALFAGGSLVVLGDAEGFPLGSPVCFALLDVESAREVSRVDGFHHFVGRFGCHGGSPVTFGLERDTKNPSYQRTGLWVPRGTTFVAAAWFVRWPLDDAW